VAIDIGIVSPSDVYPDSASGLYQARTSVKSAITGKPRCGCTHFLSVKGLSAGIDRLPMQSGLKNAGSCRAPP
jgi:hypothetical protein